MTEKRYISAEEILAAEDIRYEDVDVPEWGEGAVVRLRSLSGEEGAAFFERYKEGGEVRTDAALQVLSLSAVDEEGNMLFQKEHLEQLRKKSLKALNRLQTVALRLNGLMPDEGEEGDEAKND